MPCTYVLRNVFNFYFFFLRRHIAIILYNPLSEPPVYPVITPTHVLPTSCYFLCPPLRGNSFLPTSDVILSLVTLTPFIVCFLFFSRVSFWFLVIITYNYLHICSPPRLFFYLTLKHFNLSKTFLLLPVFIDSCFRPHPVVGCDLICLICHQFSNKGQTNWGVKWFDHYGKFKQKKALYIKS